MKDVGKCGELMKGLLTPSPCAQCNGEFCNGKNCDAWRQWFWPQWRLQCDELLRHAAERGEKA